MGIDYDWIFLDDSVEITDPKGFVEFLKNVDDGLRELVKYNFVYKDVDELTAKKIWAFLGFKGPYKHGPEYRIPRFYSEDKDVKESLRGLSKYVERCEFIVISEESPYDPNAIWKVIYKQRRSKSDPSNIMLQKGGKIS